MVGAALSVSGAAFQALLRNPLADPYVLGVSSGGALGAILALIFAARISLITPLAAFVGATATIAIVYFLGRREGQLGQHHAAARGHHLGVIPFRGDYFPDDDACRARPARHGVLADGRSFDAAGQ